MARALVLVAEVESLSDLPENAEDADTPPTTAGETSPPLIRWATSDPDVVIYWQIETNGGD